MGRSGEGEKNCRAYVTRKYPELDVAHSLSFFVLLLLLPTSDVSSPFNQIRLPTLLPTLLAPRWPGREWNRKQTGGFFFLEIRLILICIVLGIQIYILCLLLAKRRSALLQRSAMQGWARRRRSARSTLPFVKPCVLYVFVCGYLHTAGGQCVT